MAVSLLVRLACVMGKSVMGENKLILILLALFCGRALCTSEVGGNMCEENLVMSVRDKHAELGFYRCDGESVTTTIKVDRFTSKDPSLVIDISVNESKYVSYLCGVDYMSSIEDNGRILGYVNFNENCNQALIVFNPPPAIGARITIHIDNGTNQTDYGPYFIGQEGIMFLSQNMSESCEDLTLWLTNLTHCNPYMPPYNVHVTYGKNTLILRKNGSSSTLGPKCISLHPPTCQTNGTMELRLSLNASDERCQNSTLSRVVAKYEDVIQQQASVNVTACTMPKDPENPTGIQIVIPVAVIIVIAVVAAIIIITVITVVIRYKYCRKKEDPPRNGVAGRGIPLEDLPRNGVADTETPLVKPNRETGRPGGPTINMESNQLTGKKSTTRAIGTDKDERGGTDSNSGDSNVPADMHIQVDTDM